MARSERFTFLCDTSERQAIADLATRLQRSQSDAVRFVITEATRQLIKAQLTSDRAISAKDRKRSEGGQDAND